MEQRMRIDRLHVENFKKFAKEDFDLHPQFTVLVGENGSGKTSVLDALAVAMAVWLVRPPDSEVQNSRRGIFRYEIRLEPRQEGDRIQFREMPPVSIAATGNIAGNEGVQWTRRNLGYNFTNDGEADTALKIIAEVYEKDRAGQKVLCPVLAYYGAGRAWLPSNKRTSRKAKANGPARRWAAFYDCFNERIRFPELQKWFSREAAERGNRSGRWRPGFEAVRRAVLRCVPDAGDVWFDTDREQIVLSIGGSTQPFDNLSAGQRMMLAMVADLAIKTVTQNAFLLPPDELGPEDEPLPRVLRETPGVVLIDELDVHLHPKWQRQAIDDLRSTFPSLQFVATTHSPFVIQALGGGKLIQLGHGVDHIDPTGETIEDIAEAVQGIDMPQRSKRAERLSVAAERYFRLVKSGDSADPAELASAEKEFREASEGFSTQPGLEALLKLEALAAEYKVK